MIKTFLFILFLVIFTGLIIFANYLNASSIFKNSEKPILKILYNINDKILANFLIAVLAMFLYVLKPNNLILFAGIVHSFVSFVHIFIYIFFSPENGYFKYKFAGFELVKDYDRYVCKVNNMEVFLDTLASFPQYLSKEDKDNGEYIDLPLKKRKASGQYFDYSRTDRLYHNNMFIMSSYGFADGYITAIKDSNGRYFSIPLLRINNGVENFNEINFTDLVEKYPDLLEI